MKHSRFYIGCKTANEAEAKIVFSLEDEIITAFFDSIDAASDYLHNWVMGDENLLPFNYEYYTRHYNWDSGCRYNTWDLVEIGSSERYKAWANMIGVDNA